MTSIFERISIVTVCLNAQSEIQKTIDSVLEQDYPSLEYIVCDGGSSDGTDDIISSNAERLDHWQSKPDLGVYHAMNDALPLCSGEWVLFMNAGDTFSTPDSLSRMFRSLPKGTDIVYGHHLYVNDGKEEYHAAAEFESTWTRLKKGKLGFDWLAGIPGHQATAVRRSLLQKLKFDTDFRIAADHDFLFRARAIDAKFFNSNELISIYVGGGFSSKHYDVCKSEWRQIAERYGHVKKARKFYGELDKAEARANSANIGGPIELISGFDRPEGPYENENLPAFRWMLYPSARIRVANGKWLYLKVGTFISGQVVTVTVGDKQIARVAIRRLGRWRRFAHVYVDLSKAESHNEIDLRFAKGEFKSGRAIAVLLADYKLKAHLSTPDQLRRLLRAIY